MKLLLLCSIFFLNIISCQLETERKSYVPVDRVDKTYFNKYQALSKQLGLVNEHDSLVVRIWEEGPFDRFWMTQFIYDSEQSTKCTFTIFDTWQDEKGRLLEKPVLDSISVKCAINDAATFYEELLEAGFDTLMSQSDYPDYENHVADGVSYSLEVIQGDYSKFIIFHCPAAYMNKSNMAFLKILDVSEKYVNLYRPKKCGK